MKHRVNIGRSNRLYGLRRVWFEEGTKVEFTVMFATDTDYRVYSSQTAVTLEYVENGYIGHYSFIMPECDVNVTVESHNSMFRLPQTKPEPETDGQTEGTVCLECGSPVSPEQKFCHSCGRKLK